MYRKFLLLTLWQIVVVLVECVTHFGRGLTGKVTRNAVILLYVRKTNKQFTALQRNQPNRLWRAHKTCLKIEYNRFREDFPLTGTEFICILSLAVRYLEQQSVESLQMWSKPLTLFQKCI